MQGERGAKVVAKFNITVIQIRNIHRLRLPNHARANRRKRRRAKAKHRYLSATPGVAQAALTGRGRGCRITSNQDANSNAWLRANC
jgi:hypothetical protein